MYFDLYTIDTFRKLYLLGSSNGFWTMLYNFWKILGHLELLWHFGLFLAIYGIRIILTSLNNFGISSLLFQINLDHFLEIFDDPLMIGTIWTNHTNICDILLHFPYLYIAQSQVPCHFHVLPTAVALSVAHPPSAIRNWHQAPGCQLKTGENFSNI